jgi:hypothetical protein
MRSMAEGVAKLELAPSNASGGSPPPLRGGG